MNWHTYFFTIANAVALKSKDPSSQFGAIVVDEDHNIISVGYNGFPRGVNDDPARYEDRPIKYKLVVHAEANAIAAAARRGMCLENASLYVQAMPCNECAKLIVQAGIKKVFIPNENYRSYYERWAEACQWSEIIFREGGVEVCKV